MRSVPIGIWGHKLGLNEIEEIAYQESGLTHSKYVLKQQAIFNHHFSFEKATTGIKSCLANNLRSQREFFFNKKLKFCFSSICCAAVATYSIAIALLMKHPINEISKEYEQEYNKFEENPFENENDDGKSENQKGEDNYDNGSEEMKMFESERQILYQRAIFRKVKQFVESKIPEKPEYHVWN